jgi:hypothetical protein
MEKRQTRRIFATALFSNIGKTTIMIMSHARVKRSRFLKVVLIRLCGIIHPSGGEQQSLSGFLFRLIISWYIVPPTTGPDGYDTSPSP